MGFLIYNRPLASNFSSVRRWQHGWSDCSSVFCAMWCSHKRRIRFCRSHRLAIFGLAVVCISASPRSFRRPLTGSVSTRRTVWHMQPPLMRNRVAEAALVVAQPASVSSAVGSSRIRLCVTPAWLARRWERSWFSLSSSRTSAYSVFFLSVFFSVDCCRSCSCFSILLVMSFWPFRPQFWRN